MTYADHLTGGEGRVLTEAASPGAVRENEQTQPREPWPSHWMPMRVYTAKLDGSELEELPVVGMPRTLVRENGGCGVPGCLCCGTVDD